MTPTTATSRPPQLRRRGFKARDGLILAGLALALGGLAWRALIDFSYDWQWSDMPRYLLYCDEAGWQPGVLLRGLGLTLKLAVWASAVAMLAGLALALARLSRSLYLKLMARTVVEVCRNIPPLVLVFIAFYFLSAALLPWDRLLAFVNQWPPALKSILEASTMRTGELNVFFPAVAALALYEAAYFAEIFRGAILSVSRGQGEAAWCLGLSRWQSLRSVILPQAFRKAVPQLAGQFISTVKESSIVSVLSLAELTYSGQQLSTTTHRLFEVWLTVAALYFAFNFSLSLFFQRLER
ncbi:MAG: amino acid ABC transporter permease [Candidatus Adiutrix sp.]|jgi:polar amino acid transport system permease protein|nr:amino acid ABC transporter permease [Candidatus Adiutrix sp.]